MKLKVKSIVNSIKKYKIHRNKFNERSVRPLYKTPKKIAKRNKRPEFMVKYTIYGSQDLILLRNHFFPNCSIDSDDDN